MMALAMMWAVEWRKNIKGFAVLGSENPHVNRAIPIFERPVEIDDVPAGNRGNRHVGQPLADRQGNIARADRVREFLH